MEPSVLDTEPMLTFSLLSIIKADAPIGKPQEVKLGKWIYA